MRTTRRSWQNTLPLLLVAFGFAVIGISGARPHAPRTIVVPAAPREDRRPDAIRAGRTQRTPVHRSEEGARR